MKPLLWVLSSALLFSTPNAISQQYAKNTFEDARYNSEAMEVNQKGKNLEFGPYRILSAKKGILKSGKLFEGFFRSRFVSQETRHSSFLLVGDEHDSVLVQIHLTNDIDVEKTHTIEYNNGKWSRPVQYHERPIRSKMITDITVLPDSSKWQLTDFEDYSNPDSSYFVLSDGKLVIPVKQIADIFSRWQHGYEFTLNEKSIGAVKTSNQRLAWIDKNLDSNTKLAVVAAIASMLFISPR